MSRNKQFTTNLHLNNEPIDIINEARLLGLYLSNDLKWNLNTKKIVQKGNIAMKNLHTASKFTSSIKDLKAIYFSKVRSNLEYACTIWHSGLSKKNCNDIERLQRSAVKVILKDRYSTYKKALKDLRIDSLEKRREKLCLSFAKKCLKNQKMKELFPLNKSKHTMKTRKGVKYHVNKAKSERYKKSPLVYMQNLLNNSVNGEICTEQVHKSPSLSFNK